MRKAYFDQIGGLDELHYGKMGKEAQEISLKTWLSGGRVILNRNAWYGHWDKDRGLYQDMRGEKEKSQSISSAGIGTNDGRGDEVRGLVD